MEGSFSVFAQVGYQSGLASGSANCLIAALEDESPSMHCSFRG